MSANSEILLKRLQTLDFLRGLDEATLCRLAESATWKVFAPNAVVFWEGTWSPICSTWSTVRSKR